MTDFVRVSDAVTGHHVSLPRGYAEAHSSRFSTLKQPATDVNGRPLPAKHKLPRASVQGSAPEAAETEANKEAKK